MPADEIFLKGLATLGLEADEEKIEKLDRFFQLLIETNKKFNLTSVTDPDEIWERHGLDALCLAPLLPKNRHIFDLGSGAGIPAIPLAIWRADLDIFCFESRSKKAAFIHDIAILLKLPNISTWDIRIEEAGHKEAFREKADVVTGRAFAGLSAFLEMGFPLLRTGGLFLPLKGDRIQEELLAAKEALVELHGALEEIRQPLGPEGSSIPVIRKQHKTPSKYPRKQIKIKKHPL